MTFSRSTFVLTNMALQAIALFCVFFSITSVSAVPQFGRPLLHALDAPQPSRLAVPLVAVSTSSSSTPTLSGTPVATANTTATSTQTSAPTSGSQTSGASHGLSLQDGVHAALVFSAAASAALLVF